MSRDPLEALAAIAAVPGIQRVLSRHAVRYECTAAPGPVV